MLRISRHRISMCTTTILRTLKISNWIYPPIRFIHESLILTRADNSRQVLICIYTVCMVETMESFHDILRWAYEPLKGQRCTGASYLVTNGPWISCSLCGTGGMLKQHLAAHLGAGSQPYQEVCAFGEAPGISRI